VIVPRYFLHIVRDDTRIEDPEGEEQPNLAGAKESAAESAFDLTIENMRRTGRVSEVTIEIADEAGNILARVSFPPD
jgi:hypothetical protein